MSNNPLIGQLTVYDIESYPNYFLATFFSADEEYHYFNETQLKELSTFIQDKRLIGFNNHFYDDLILYAICIGDVSSAASAWELTKNIIEGPQHGEPSWGDGYRWKLESNRWCIQSLDIKRVAFKPGDSLKKLEAAYHFPNLEDLPFPPGTILTDEQKGIVKKYCVNDVAATYSLIQKRQKDLELKQLLTEMYDVDVRSAGNASAAEQIVRNLYMKKRNESGNKPTFKQLRLGANTYNEQLSNTGITDIIPDKVQSFLEFNNSQMQGIYESLLVTPISVDENGELDKGTLHYELAAYGLSFTITAGGFHSEDPVSIHTGDLIDYDVTSFYPSMMVAYNIHPATYGGEFLEVFEGLIQQRVTAKRDGNSTTADALKLAINSVYGKLNDKHSTFKDPHAMLQVTVTGQLLLIKLIEMLHDAGISILSANTDGVLMQTEDRDLAAKIAFQWETLTGLNLEHARYNKVVRRSVNDYIALSIDGKIKRKGVSFACGSTIFPKPPANDIIKDAAVEYFMHGIDPAVTITRSNDITKFIATYSATGQMEAIIDDTVVQKSNRWYHSIDSTSTVKRRRKDGSGTTTTIDTEVQLVNNLPNSLPADLDHNWYISKAKELIDDIKIKSAPPGPTARKAIELSSQGIGVIPMTGLKNASGTKYNGSRKWESWEYDMHPNLGILNGVESMLYTVSIVDPIKLPDDLVELLKLDDTMVICSDNVAPNDVRMGKGAGTLIFQSVNPSPIKNIKRIKSNGFKVDATKSSTPCYGPMLNSPHYYQMSGSIKASTELECWLRFKF